MALNLLGSAVYPTHPLLRNIPMLSFSRIQKAAGRRLIRTYNKCSPLSSDFINIILRFHSKGLLNDAAIIKFILTTAGFKTRIIENRPGAIFLKSRVNLFLETVNRKLLSFGKHNLFISNPEWDLHDFDFLRQNIDVVISKTKDCERIFSTHSVPVQYTSFTSHDIYEKMDAARKYVHFAGKSTHKGTASVINTWNRNKHLPKLYLYSYLNDYSRQIETDNIIYQHKQVLNEEIKRLQLCNIFHVSPSEYEGFGHQINEAKSAAAIVLTTDAPPMNELITNDFGFLIKATAKEMRRKAMLFSVSERDLYEKVMASRDLSTSETERMRAASRESYQLNDLFFRERLVQVLQGYF